ncbi:hypothetical protein BJX76DRAFT_317865 [Aspergillus varians]
MCGLLALSAFPRNTMTEQHHRKRASEFCSAFRTGWEESTATASKDMKEAATQVECLLRCAHWALAESPSDQCIMREPGVPDQLQCIMATLQASTPAAAQHPREETPAYALRILTWGPSELGSLSPGNSTPAGICDRLRALPAHMADTFGRPENTQGPGPSISGSIPHGMLRHELCVRRGRIGVVGDGHLAGHLAGQSAGQPPRLG